MPEHLMINLRINYENNKNALTVLKTRDFLLKSEYQVKMNLISQIPIYDIRHELQGKLSSINGKDLILVKCEGHFSFIGIYNIFLHCLTAYGLHLDECGNRDIKRVKRKSLKYKSLQHGQLLGVAFLSRVSSAFETGLQNPFIALEFMYLHPCLVLDAPLPQPSPPAVAMYPRLQPPDFPPLQPSPPAEATYPRQLAPGDPPPQPTPSTGSQQQIAASISQASLRTTQSVVSRLPVVMRSSMTLARMASWQEDENFDPYKERIVSHPTTDTETLIHLMKGSLGTGILAMPFAIKCAGLFFGLFATFFVGAVCVYSVKILVESSHKLCKKMKVPALGFDDIAEVAFFAGPPKTRKFATTARFTVNFFLVLDLIGCCCVYIVFVASNLKQVIDVHLGKEIELRHCMIILLPFLICMNLIPHLKYLAPFSMLANVLMAVGMGITFYYIFQDLPSVTSRPKFSSVGELPIFFGTAIFALEGIGVVMPLENNMKTPENFLGCFGVLNIGMFFVVMLYAGVGFFGYLKYGAATEASITLNLPDELLAQSVKMMIAVAIFLTYSLQFHVPLEIILKGIKHKFSNYPKLGEGLLRVSLVTLTVLIAVLLPHLGPFISLVGAVCLSFLGMMFPAIVEIVVCWEDGLGKAKWILWKNLAIISFGLLGFFTGSYTSILDIIKEHKKIEHDL